MQIGCEDDSIRGTVVLGRSSSYGVWDNLRACIEGRRPCSSLCKCRWSKYENVSSSESEAVATVLSSFFHFTRPSQVWFVNPCESNRCRSTAVQFLSLSETC